MKLGRQDNDNKRYGLISLVKLVIIIFLLSAIYDVYLIYKFQHSKKTRGVAVIYELGRTGYKYDCQLKYVYEIDSVVYRGTFDTEKRTCQGYVVGAKCRIEYVKEDPRLSRFIEKIE